MFKKITLIFVTSILLGTVFSSYTCAFNSKIITKGNNLETQNSHIINGVPYIPQNQGYFCGYACRVMILNYMGLNTTLDEFLFYDGVGHTHSYYNNNRLPKESCYIDTDYVVGLFGVTEEWWFSDNNLPNDENWNIYFTKIIDNIKNETPVITRVDPFSMPSLKEQYKIPDYLWNKIFPQSHHLILVLGYNEANQSICYNDPNAGYYGDKSYGDHAWISINDFKNAVNNITAGWNRFIIFTLKQTGQPLPKEERFKKSFIKNIQSLNSSYKWYYNNNGINASKEIKNYYSKGQENRTKTIELYKQQGKNSFNNTITEIMHSLISFFFPNKPNIFDIFMNGIHNPFYEIYMGKKHVADYLETNTDYSDLSKNQSVLLRKESDLWKKMSQYYNIFLKRGIKLSNFRASFLMYRMEKTMSEIIQIEQQIIDEGSLFIFS